ncbi:MAG: phenylacetate--CoA ligase [Sulfobacillus thermosulfidooxidans]|uniref:Phenylacetate-coenzyme A ligase n=1 Tax=Sulfobacillus thermotolerans TaxID=338644 RepID=A0ABM6RQU8_9FIRM|nr:phenylacetate--CoA ligase [Sulfobacillus sp. hq2]AUW93826.1 phenylacetate--CoA ligase [Sulfobacillus thermotolerans]MCY0908759.1 phenylacetate--CoA ligase [Sulfobacillus thermotolerans]POB11361.1 phenylacetate--CoA ligase [Sulfobacillus sp. hq2]PSR36960.1 MAG: phenylacetate--CoA ligase [Sulfobacillus thermosulfidooxidans]
MMLDPEIETMSRDQMQALQLRRLQTTLERVYQSVPFYRQAMDEAHVRPEDIQSMEDIVRLPFTRKSHLRDQYPFGLIAVPMDQVVRFHASSGTRGKPTVVAYTKGDISRWAHIVARQLACAGARPGDRFHNAYGYGLFTGGLGLHYGIEELGAAVIPVSGGNTPRQVRLIEDFRPRGISGTPSYILNIAEEMRALGLNPHETSLEYGILGAEPWSEALREEIQNTLGIKAIDIYGLSEVIGPGVAMECWEAQNGLHIAEDHFLAEIIDPETGLPVPYGETGELVFTSLTKEAFPVIRYRTGDIASLNPEPCVCGRTVMRMSRIKGRLDDMLIIRGVNVFPTEIEYVLLQVDEIAPHYQVVVDHVGTLDTLEVHCEVTPEFHQATATNPEDPRSIQLHRQILHALKSELGISVGLKIHQPGTIARSEGKAVRIVDNRVRSGV